MIASRLMYLAISTSVRLLFNSIAHNFGTDVYVQYNHSITFWDWSHDQPRYHDSTARNNYNNYYNYHIYTELRMFLCSLYTSINSAWRGWFWISYFIELWLLGLSCSFDIILYWGGRGELRVEKKEN